MVSEDSKPFLLYGKFPIKTTNALGHFETKTFDAKTGNILTLTGPNGLNDGVVLSGDKITLFVYEVR
jgi:hypothetical protein